MRVDNDKTKQSLADAYMAASPAIFFCWGAEAGWPVDYVSDNVDLLGYSVEEFVEGRRKFADIIHPDDLEHVIQEVGEYTERQDRSFTQSYRLLSRDGDVHWIDDRTVVERDAGGKATRYLGIITDITREKVSEEALKLSQARYRALVETTDDFVWEVDANGIYSYCSPQIKRILGHAPQAMLGKTPFDFMSPGEAERIAEKFRAIIDRRAPFSSLENTNLHSDGHEIVLETSGVPFFDADGQLAGYRGIDRDITERKQAERRLKEQQEFLQSVVDGVHDTIMVIGEDCGIQLMNKAARASMNPECVADIHNPKCYEVFHRRKTPCNGKAYPCPMQQVVESGKPVTVVHNHAGPDGKPLHVELIAAPLRAEDGAIRGIIETARDITGHLSAQQQLVEQKASLERLAHHDALTALPNRLLFLDRLRQAIKKAHRETNQLAVLFVDLDRFKQINDSLGHTMGDAVLKVVAHRLQNCLREEDVVARLGGDEFTIIMGSLHKPQHAMAMAQKLIRSVQHPVSHDDHELYVSASVGISLYPQDGQTADKLLQNADVAMYKAKHEGRRNFQFYTSDMTKLAIERVRMESQLHRALEKQQFVVYYQPQLDLLSGKLIGLEALVRWQHPELGLLLPTRFIPLAEDTGLILPLGRWVLETACRQIAEWHAANLYPGRIAVNLTGNQLKNDKFIPTIEQILEASSCKPDWLELEITESVIMEQRGRSFTILQRLKEQGIELAIDDFGTGYSSLAHLKRLPVSRLKIDRSFIRDIPHDASNKAIARAVIAMGRSMGLKVIAEGVETVEQKTFLAAERCDEIQGYLNGRPLPAGQMSRLLSSSQPRSPV